MLVRGSERQKAIDRFETEEDSFMFLLSTRAGGVGINLTAAGTCRLTFSDSSPFFPVHNILLPISFHIDASVSQIFVSSMTLIGILRMTSRPRHGVTGSGRPR